MKKPLIIGSLTLTLTLLAGSANAQQACRPSVEQCNQRLRHSGRRVVGPAFNASTTPCAANIAPSDNDCTTQYDTAELPREVVIVPAVTTTSACTGMLGSLRCRGTAAPAVVTQSHRPSSSISSSSFREVRAELHDIKELLARYIASQIALTGRVASAEEAMRLYGVQIRYTTDSIIAMTGISRDELAPLMVRLANETDDSGAVQRVGDRMVQASRELNQFIHRIADREANLEVEFATFRRSNGRGRFVGMFMGSVLHMGEVTIPNGGVALGGGAALDDQGNHIVEAVAILGLGTEGHSPFTIGRVGVSATYLFMATENVGFGGGATWNLASTMGQTNPNEINGMIFHSGGLHGALRIRYRAFSLDAHLGFAAGTSWYGTRPAGVTTGPVTSFTTNGVGVDATLMAGLSL